MTQIPDDTILTESLWPKRLGRVAFRVGRVLVIMYAVVFFLGWILQEKLIFPGAWMSQGKPEAAVACHDDEELVPLTTANGVHTVAWFGTALTPRGQRDAHPEKCPTLLYFYGNGEWLAEQDWQLTEFRKLGLNVIIPEYPGFGLANGEPSEAGCYAVAEATYQYVLSRTDLDQNNLLTGGWSLGAAVACDLAAKKQDRPDEAGTGRIRGVFMFSAFTSMHDVACLHYGFLPVSLILRHHFKSEEKIRSLHIPILLAHGTADSNVPYAMSLRLRTAAIGTPQVRHLPIDGAGHNDLYTVGETPIFAALRQWLADCAAPTP